MSDNPRGTNPFDPTDERTAEQSTQAASGLTSGAPAEPVDAADDDCPDREDTPRRYEHPADPALPADDASLPTKI